MNESYTNPAFYISETPPAKIQRHDPNFRSVRDPKKSVFRVAPNAKPQNLNNTFNGMAMMGLGPALPPKPGPKPIGLSTIVKTDQFHQQQQKQQRFVEGLSASGMDKNGSIMRSQSLLDHRTTSIESLPLPTVHPSPAQQPTVHTPSGRYALVPIEEVPKAAQDRYEILPLQTRKMLSFHKSHDQIFSNKNTQVLDEGEEEEAEEAPHNTSHPQFSSLPYFNEPKSQMKNAFSTNFEPKSQMKNAFSTNFDPNQFLRSDSKYTLIPTDKDEDIVDDNHEVIEIHNGKQVHRYAVLSTEIDEEDEDLGEEEEEETCLSDNGRQHQMIPQMRPMQPMQPLTPLRYNANHNNYATIQEKSVASPQKFQQPMATSSPQRILTPQQQKNLATQRLHELLSTPPKPKTPAGPNRTPQKMTRFQSTPTRYEYERREEVYQRTTTPNKQYTPQRLNYDQRTMSMASVATTATNGDLRTTAVITPRLLQLESSDSRDLEAFNKSRDSEIYKIASAARTIGGIAFMMILCGVLNSGLCLYIIALQGLVYYLISGIIAGFLCIALGSLGLKSQRTPWFPNRNYMSGLVLVIVFALLNSSALSALIAIRPAVGSPIHDMITSVVLGLSVLKVILICLGVVTSQCCNVPPPDNRVQVR